MGCALPRGYLALALGTVAVGLLCGPALAQGLDPAKAITQYNLDVWTTAENLPQNSVTALLQTRDGYLWLGTYGGLVRFDGVQFTVFHRGNTDGLRGNGITALLEDREGALWIGTDGAGLCRLRDGRFTTFTTADGLPHDIVRTLYQDSRGDLWIGTNDGIARFREGRFTAYTTKDGLPAGTVRAIQEDPPGVLWLGTNGGGLVRFADGRFQALTHKDGLPSKFVFALHRDREGALWIGTNGGGLCRRAGDRLVTYTTRDGLSSNIIWSLHEDAHGSLWVGTYGGGLCRLREGRFSCFSTRDGLSNDFVRSLWSDREGSLWIGTYSGGLNRLRDGKVTTYTRREGLANDFARAIYQDREGAIWIGTTGGGLSRFQGGRFRTFGPREGVGTDVRALHEDGAGALWVGSSRHGLARLSDGRFRRYTTRDGLAHMSVSALVNDRAGALWIGTNGGGLGRFENGRFATWTAKDGLPSNFILAALVDRDDALWLGTDGSGLCRFKDGRFTTYTRRDGLASDIVFTIHEDALGALWIGTSGGLTRIRNGRFATLTTREGLLDDVVFQVLEDGDGRFWLSGNRGISRLAAGELEAVAEGRARAVTAVGYGTADGMKSNECSGLTQPAGILTREGKLWFPTARGVVMIDPRRNPRNALPPSVKVEEVLADGEPAGENVPPGKERWEFRYAGLSLLAPQRVLFKYKLEGFDQDWIPAGTRRAAYYTRIPPGHYTFRVIACNNDGVWNETGDKVSFTLRPYFHQTGWFYALLALVTVLAGGAAVSLRVRHLESRKRELEAIVEVRTRDLVREKERTESALKETERQKEIAQGADRLKSELLSIAAHDLKSPLQSIIGYADLTAAQPGITEAVGEFTRHSALAARRMVEIIDRLLEAGAIDQGKLVLERKAVDMGRLTLAQAGVHQPLAESKKQRIHVSVEEGCLVRGDESSLRQVLDNLLSNAIKFSPPRRSIWVMVRRDAGSTLLEVKDEGPGLTDADRGRIFGRFQRLSARPTGGESSTGLGLSIVKQLVELQEGTIRAESEGPGRGSRFVVVLPGIERA